MKKLLCVLVMIIMSFTMFACGNNEGSDQNTEETTATTAEQTESSVDFDYSLFSGTYYDSVSERAGAELTPGENSVHIIVSWGSSASETEVWEMDAHFDGEAKFVYDNCKSSSLIFDEDGNETEEVHYENGSGYFDVAPDGTLYWKGAADEGCTECVFEKAEE